MENFINTDLIPLEVNDFPWLYENKNNGVKKVDSGKWMLFYDKSLMNEAYNLSKTNRKKSDEKYFQADEILKEIEILKRN